MSEEKQIGYNGLLKDLAQVMRSNKSIGIAVAGKHELGVAKVSATMIFHDDLARIMNAFSNHGFRAITYVDKSRVTPIIIRNVTEEEKKQFIRKNPDWLDKTI